MSKAEYEARRRVVEGMRDQIVSAAYEMCAEALAHLETQYKSRPNQRRNVLKSQISDPLIVGHA